MGRWGKTPGRIPMIRSKGEAAVQRRRRSVIGSRSPGSGTLPNGSSFRGAPPLTGETETPISERERRGSIRIAGEHDLPSRSYGAVNAMTRHSRNRKIGSSQSIPRRTRTCRGSPAGPFSQRTPHPGHQRQGRDDGHGIAARGIAIHTGRQADDQRPQKAQRHPHPVSHWAFSSQPYRLIREACLSARSSEERT